MKWSEATCGQIWWPILGICALHLTHPNAHTQQWTHTHTHTHTHTYCCGTRGAVGGLVPCSRASHLSRGIEGGRERWLFTPKSKWLDNWHCLGFWGIKKKEWVFIIVGWLCPHTAKTHLYANEDILHPMSPLKLNYYNLNSSDERFRKSDSKSVLSTTVRLTLPGLQWLTVENIRNVEK